MKKFIIHALGGFTKEECVQHNVNHYNLGCRNTCDMLKRFADQMHGMSADDWCKMMYNHICGTITRLESPASGSRAVGESSDTPGYIEDAPYPC